MTKQASTSLERTLSLARGRGLNDAALARSLGVSQQTLQNWKTRKHVPELRLPRIAAEFGVSVDWLLGRESPARQGEEAVDLHEPPTEDETRLFLKAYSQLPKRLRFSLYAMAESYAAYGEDSVWSTSRPAKRKAEASH
jgi:transcriptional regulator with XRE-family HTH domain